MKHLVRSLTYLKRHWLLAAGAFFSLLLSSAASLVIPRMTQIIIDDGITGGDFSRVISAAGTMIALAIGGAAFSFAQGVLSARTGQGVAYDLRNDLYNKIQSLSFSYHDRAQTGQLLTRATSDVEMVYQFVGAGFIRFLSALLMMSGSLILVFVMDWKLALIMVVLAPMTFGVFGFFASKARPLFTQIQQRLSFLNTVLQENIVGVRVVKAFVREPYEAERYEKANNRLFDLYMTTGRMFAAALPLIFLLANLATLSVYWIGGYQAIAGQMSIGRLVAFSNYLMMAFFPMIMLGFIIAMVSQASASAERIFEILDAQVEVVDAPDAVQLPPIKGKVAFENVRFGYYKGSDLVLEDINFVAEPGRLIALLGATGSGKSTVVDLIPRFYDVTGGSVRIDGYDVRQVTQESLRGQIGIVFQESTLFSATIRDNIVFGRKDATDEEVLAAAKAAEAHDFILGFPEGYETHVGERGTTLSGGQKQRIAIARALILDPRILILDDATANVDYETEERIQRALERLMVGRTSFVIAQRIATVLNADQILVLDQGRIVGRGTHEELLETNPIYADIYNSQLLPSAGNWAASEASATAAQGVNQHYV